MRSLVIKTHPDDILRQKAAPIKNITAREKELFDQMLHTMRLFHGIGLAAPQIGIAEQIIVLDIGNGPVKLANPTIIESSGAEAMVEGCLSVPDMSVDIIRAQHIVLQAIDAEGDLFTITADGLLARVLQHELDHLDGRLIIDYHDISTDDKEGPYAHI